KSRRKRSIRQLVNNDFNTTLKHITIPRTSGTEGNKIVRNYIISQMRDLGWNVSVDSFDDKTPYGSKHFSNIIATNNENACKRVSIACHYDSKYFPLFDFVGAIDSAVPCALLIHLAALLRHELDRHRAQNLNPSLQFIFFDGEEAFHLWSAKDSLYGARHLAEKWHKTQVKNTGNCHLDNELQRMTALILLDLIGANNMKFNNFFANTSYLYLKLMAIGKSFMFTHIISNTVNKQIKAYLTFICNLSIDKEIPTKQYNNNRNQLFPSSQVYNYGIQDDHEPFLKKGVPILHLITSPFPPVWHQEDDDIDHLDFYSINIFENIFYDFLKSVIRG
ncbi:unnamed protein product, partial [Oppiella nova]